jgi:hypothetical protein
MGYALLWIENLAVSLLLVATVFSFVGRLRRRWLRDVLWMPVPVVLFLWYAFLVCVTAACAFLSHTTLPATWFGAAVALAISFLVGAVWLKRRGLRRVDDGTAPTVAGSWPCGKLAIALGVAVALHLMTFWNLDLAVRQQAENLRAEAGALALSVAPPRIPDCDNAAILYEQTYEALLPLESDKQPALVDKFGDPAERNFDPKNAELRKLLKDYSSVLRILREAASKPNCYFERDYHWPSITTMLPEVRHLRVAATMLALDARVQAGDGNVRAAIEDINAMFAMSQHVKTDAFLVCVLASFGIEQQATAAFQSLLLSSKLSEDNLGLLRSAVVPSHQRLVEYALRGEEACRLTTFCEVGRGELTCSFASICWGDTRSAPASDTEFADILGSLYRVFMFANDLAEHRRLSQQMRAIAEKPHYQAAAQWEDFDAQLSNGKITGLLTRVLLPATRLCCMAGAQADARYRAFQLGLAAEKYRLRNRRLPTRLEDLTPDFIPVVPLDPFDGKPMRMKRTDHSLIVYSIGPDGIDNGGTPIDLKKPTRGRITDQTGDIIFEVPDRKP